MRFRSLAAALLATPLVLLNTSCAYFEARGQGDSASRPAHATLPKPETLELANGMTILVVYRPSLPVVSMNVVLRAGDVADPVGKGGLASLTAGLLKRGTRTRSAPEIADAIDAVGGSLSTSSGADTAAVGVNVLTKDVDLAVDLLSDVLLHPAFSPAELAREKEEASAGLKSSLDDANEVVRVALIKQVLAGNPYGQSATLRSLEGISLADVKRFYATYYRPNNAIVSVVGNLTVDDVRRRFEASFAHWQPAAIPTNSASVLAPVVGRHVELVDMDVNQSFILLGHAGVKRNNPDFFPLIVLNFILGGDFTSRLNLSIRDRQGLAYGAGSSFHMMRDTGYFFTYLNTRTPATGKALDSLLKELKTIQQGEVTPYELSTAKAYLTGSFPLRFETNEQLAGEIVNQQVFGLPANYLATYHDNVEAVTAQDVLRVAKTYLHPDDYDLVVVTKAAEVESALGAFGQVRRVSKDSLIR